MIYQFEKLNLRGTGTFVKGTRVVFSTGVLFRTRN